MMKYRTLQKLDTTYHADSVEFCPCDPFTEVMLCGTYQLQDQTEAEVETVADVSSQNRLGRLYMYEMKNISTEPSLMELEHEDMAGILDIKWFRKLLEDQMYFGVVNSIGHLMLYSLVNTEDGFHLKYSDKCELGDEVIGLSLDTSQIVSHRIATSDSAGNVSLCHLTKSAVEVLKSWKAHDYEAWITAQDQHDANLVFSGGDDCKLKIWDIRTDLQSPVCTSKRHSMGVTSLQGHPKMDNIFASGSYDEHLMIWDKRNMKQPLSESRLGGGIWRIKWSPTGNFLLTASMHNGFHIVEYDQCDFGQEVKLHYTQHDSLAYGVDWCNTQEGNLATTSSTDKIIASCSFYDHNLQLWRWESDVT